MMVLHALVHGGIVFGRWVSGHRGGGSRYLMKDIKPLLVQTTVLIAHSLIIISEVFVFLTLNYLVPGWEGYSANY
jgi:hypothetical protein